MQNVANRMQVETRVEEVAQNLINWITDLKSVVVAFSGGVDSAVVAAASYRALGGQAVAVTGHGDAVAIAERKEAEHVASQIGIRHVVIVTQEIDDENYLRNDANRCFYCKSNLYHAIEGWLLREAESMGISPSASIFSGTNLDDLGDYRPGLRAASEHKVLAPLAELGIGKATVRQLARHFGLSIAEKPASPCLASRIAYGQSVTSKRLKSIELAEAYLHELGFEDVRVRLHADELVRLEIHEKDLPMACAPGMFQTIATRMVELGFRFVTLDLMGRQSGSLNRALPVIQKR
jgi:pyridinium-3,5-biscarboxylic acid mononucleotide sulfurtransferase